MNCVRCLDTGHVCEDHPAAPWEGMTGPVAAHPEHGGMGNPCPACCLPVPADGTRPAADAFAPACRACAHPLDEHDADEAGNRYCRRVLRHAEPPSCAACRRVLALLERARPGTG
nr:hypothetical protein OG781_09725 [Streptomyces sp. NBC_00830]